MSFRKVIMNLICLAYLSILLCSCGVPAMKDGTPDQTSANTTQEKNPTYSCELQASQPFSENRAWIQFFSYDQGQSFIGCIDKDGQLIFCYEYVEILHTTDFQNGVSYITSRDGNLYVVNDEGEILSSYPLDEGAGEQVLLYEDGYVLTVRNESSFDSTQYSYQVYDAIGTPAGTRLVRESEYPGYYYCGSGIFGFRITQGEYDYWNPTGDFWQGDGDDSGLHMPYFYTNVTVVGNAWDYDNSRMGGIVLMDKKGTEHTIYTQYLDHVYFYPSYVINDWCVINDMDNNLVSINVATGESYTMDSRYSSRLAKNDDTYYTPTDGRIVVNMYGDDSQRYTGIFNEKLELICEPIKGSGKCYSDNRLLIRTDEGVNIYNENGEIVYSLQKDNSWYMGDCRYSDGVLVIQTNNDFAFYDVDGKELFDEITYDLSTLVSLK